MLIDSHCHLDGPKFSADREAVLERAKQAGVEAVVAIGNGNGPAEVDCAIKLAEQFNSEDNPAKFPKVWATIGIHPHEAQLATKADFDHMRSLARDERVIAWGEIGLDYFYDHSPRDVQREVFITQMDFAIAAKLPIVIHCRPSNADPNDAWDDCLDLIRRRYAPSGLGGVLHCFTGQWEHARAALDFGFMISFAGNVTFPKAENIREAARQVPLDRMLIETDSPYLAPIPHRGKRNEPALVVETASCIAELRGIAADELAQATSDNFFRFFKIEANGL